MTKRLKFWQLYFAIILAVGVLMGTGLVREWGRWYSANPAYRRQTEALLKGSLALEADPRGLVWDMIWANGGVQQVWGLGAPCWRLPFELLARMFRQSAFPDRLAFGVAIAFVAYAVFRVFLTRPGCNDPYQWLSDLRQHPEEVVPLFLLVLFPPFLTLCRFRFEVYEEAEAYAYLSGIALSIGTLFFIRRPKVACYAVLAFFAGLAAVVRPTLVFYGFASLLVAWINTRRLGWTLRKSFLGAAFFCAGALLLFGANVERFGSGFEFGYGLHLNDIDYARFATRFGAPYSREPFLSALSELFSSLFLVGDTFNGHAYHRDAFFPGQSGTIRWREFYFTTFDLTLLAMVALAWGWALRRYWLRRGIKNISSSLSESGDMAAWSFLGAFGLFFFYLRCPFLASRYLLDFAPAFAAALLALAQVLKEFLKARLQTRFTARWTFSALFALWYGHQLITAKSDYPSNEALTYSELTTLMQRDDPPARPLPTAYSVGMNLADYGISFNGIGWDTATGKTKSAIAIFIRDPERLELEVAPVAGTPISGTDYDQIRAKIGLESLKLESIRRTPEGAILLFRGPEKRIYRSGLQVASLGFVAPQELSVSTSRFRLLRVRWRNIDDG